jgi:outer membrane receptor for ferrienterochelin and colicins
LHSEIVNMQRKILLSLISAVFLITNITTAQDSTASKILGDVVVTGQYQPQSLKNSVYQVKTINNERIKLSGATNVQQVLNTQLGFRFSNDNILGTDVQINGMSGRNVKILLDGVPVLDRFDQRASLSQIDVNTIEKIEIIEGPMSVSFGTDAMAGVINIITKKNNKNKLTISVKLQEETAGKEYYALSHKGMHTQNIGINFNKNNWNFATGLTHNGFEGFGGDTYGRNKSWLPKEQLMGNGKIGYAKGKLDIYYRLDAMTELLKDKNNINFDNARAKDQYFTTNRFMHQVQSNVRFNEKWQLNSILAYTDFKRSTETRDLNFENNTYNLGTSDAEQDVSTLNSFSIKNVVQYKAATNISVQAGIDINNEKASGDRIVATPSINDYALFASAEYKPTSKINIRPGFRIINNSLYKAPPIIPSINTKFSVHKNIDIRLSYGMGFRAPVLRELYFNFVDVNHNVVGNKDLKAETSNSFNGSVSMALLNKNSIKLQTTIGTFYNDFDNQIELVLSKTVQDQYTYYNFYKVKTTGVNIENKISAKNIEANIGLTYVARARFFEANVYKNDNRNFLWTTEFNTNVTYKITALKTTLGFFYKFIGAKPDFSEEPRETPAGYYLTNTNSYNLADFTITTIANKFLSVNAGAKNLFNVTNVQSNTIGNSNLAHNGDGPLSISYGRSYFIGLIFNWNKK